MEFLEACRAHRVYLDANIFIYAVEGVANYLPALAPLFKLFADGGAEAVTSELSLAEALAKPFETGRPDIVALYVAMLTSSSWLTVVPVGRSVLTEAARLRSQLGLRLPDAIHVATAIVGHCSVLLSNDQRLKVPSEIQVLGLPSAREPATPVVYATRRPDLVRIISVRRATRREQDGYRDLATR